MGSDTTAFLAGCAITGVAAVLMLRGGLISDRPSIVQPFPSSATATVPAEPPALSSTPADGVDQEWRLERELEEQRAIAEELKNQLRRQQDATDDLKTELERQRNQTEQLLTELDQQVREQQRIIDMMAMQRQIDVADGSRLAERLQEMQSPQPVPASQPLNLQTTGLWILGVTIIVVALGGGILLVIFIIVLLQSQRRSPRTMHVIHPIPQPYPLPEQALLPAHRPRRTNQINQIEYYDE